MFKRLLLIFILIALVTTAADAAVVHRGKRGRRLHRHALLVQRWHGDKLAVYREYGFPVHRLRVSGYGRIREHWTYYGHGLEFIFDEDHNLLKTNSFWPEDRRGRIDRYPGY